MPESYNGDEGNEALGAGLDVMDGGENWAGVNGGWRAINKTRDYIVWALNQAKAYADGLIGSISLSWANITGKPATFPPSAHTHTRVESGINWFGWLGGGVFGTGDSVSVGADLGVDEDVFVGGHVFVPNSTAAVSGYTVAYINGPDGRLSRGASTLRYKNPLPDPDPAAVGNLFPIFREFTMKDGDGKPLFGYFAEDLAADPDLRRFVVYAYAPDDEGRMVPTDLPESIDFIQLLLAQCAQLNARVKQLEEAQS